MMQVGTYYYSFIKLEGTWTCISFSFFWKEDCKMLLKMNEKTMIKKINTKIKNCNNIYYLMQHMGLSPKRRETQNTTHRPLSVDLTRRLLRLAGHLPSAQHDRHH